MGEENNYALLVTLLLASVVIIALLVAVGIIWRNYAQILKRYYYHVSNTSHFEQGLLEILKNQTNVQKANTEEIEKRIEEGLSGVHEELKKIRSELWEYVAANPDKRKES